MSKIFRGPDITLEPPHPASDDTEWFQQEDRLFRAHRTARIDERARIGKFVHIYEHAYIEKGAQVSSWVRVGRYARIGAHARVGRRAQIDEGARLGEDVWVGEDVNVGARALVERDTRIGYGTYVPEYAGIGAHARIGKHGEGYAHGFLLRYLWDAYRVEGRALVLRYGCETHPVEAWPDLLDDLCAEYEPDRADLYYNRLTALIAAVPGLVG